MDVNTEDAIVTLSDKVWEIGELSEIKNQVSDAVFAFYIVANVIGIYKGDGWQAIIEENTKLLPYISHAMYEIGLDKIGDATKNIEQIFPLNIDVFSLDENQLCEVVNFVRGSREGKYFTITIEELKGYTSEERKQITAKYSEVCEKLEDATESMWGYNSPYWLRCKGAQLRAGTIHSISIVGNDFPEISCNSFHKCPVSSHTGTRKAAPPGMKHG